MTRRSKPQAYVADRKVYQRTGRDGEISFPAPNPYVYLEVYDTDTLDSLVPGTRFWDSGTMTLGARDGVRYTVVVLD